MIRFTYLLAILCLVVTFCPLHAQSDSEYVGSSQFFDISGTWVNNDSVNKRIAKVEIRKTIVNTYRMIPYFDLLGGVERPFDEVRLDISEELMCYETKLMEAQCMIMPMKTPAGEQLRIYSIIIDPNGFWTGMAIDVLHREQGFSANDIGPSFDPWTLEGSWVNEWDEDIKIPRFKIYSKDNELYCQPYKLLRKNNKIKVKALEEYKLEDLKSTEGTQMVKWTENSLVTKLRIRPIMEDWQVVGIDMLVEEIYEDDAPKSVYRHFFVKDPNAELKEAAEKLIATLEGNWENMDPSAATLRLNIYDSEIRVWVNCQDEEEGCSLGSQKVLEPIYEGLIGTEFTTFSTNRTLELDTELEVNASEELPNFMVLTTVIEDLEGYRPIRVRSEVFKRKGHIISGEVENLTEMQEGKR